MVRVLAAFNPNHVGTQVCEQTGAERSGKDVSEIEHSNTGHGRR